MTLIAVLAGVLLGAMASGGPNAAPVPQGLESPRVIEATHEVRFPDEVVFRLEAESSSPITQVMLFYRLGGRDSQVYGYPSFEPGTRVSAGFTLKTGGSAYVPSGVDIEYYYVIGDSSGNTHESGKLSVEYRDPRYRWRELRRGDLTVLYHDLSEERVAATADVVNERLEEVKRVAGLTSAVSLKAVIVNGRLEANRTFPVVSAAARRGHLYGGFAYADYGLFVLAGLGLDGMVHEATHLVMGQVVDSPRARIPAWLNEGLAMYFESNSGSRTAYVERAARNGDLLALRSTNTVPGRPDDVRMFYAQSWSVVDHVMETYGTEKMTELLAAIDRGVRIEDAVSQVYGVSLEDLEARWKREVVGITTLAPRTDPGTASTTFLISGAVAIAVVVTAYRWLTRRKDWTEVDDVEA